ncbi:MAG: glycosyl transferase [Candidatus Portnoybacteria bacterium CG06_land_8_20_14_3_00_39_12]|uniref:Glycosyl transferase n=2 Tax=Candidatus Portnoyibacteriota TaxID=1817913 RepID=A0A2M7UIX6_9BACT|nr:MAG: hypothetical protein AUJ33_00670 [Parcubacteria group bacterium CG1_02_40_25]PIU74857.1 MAG: glycosyl transferase [Candidatus Portnoybacteria bacterium CG06_land_8_20_14_3_00_39_12]PIZ71157.1 MAG: glycosyl transferase [Candidatus Portnoybacteria bacterium CG_4_10_14_0_2_um_filter_39_11]
MNQKIYNLPFISIILACRNEEKHIDHCLKSLLNQNYPQSKMELLVIDGLSDDQTVKIIKNYAKQYPIIKFFSNPQKITSAAFNLGIQNAQGELIILAGSHSIYPPNYIKKCVMASIKYRADNVGGIIQARPSANTIIAEAIAISLAHPFGAGNAYFRLSPPKIRWVDTVFGGCYHCSIFKKIGLFNENLVRSQDIEFNLRLKRAGGKILLIPDIISYYYPKDNLKDFFIHNFRDGIWIIYPFKFVKIPLSPRHYLPLCFILGFLTTGILGIFWPIYFRLFLLMIAFYCLIGLFFGLQTALKQKRAGYIVLLPLAFAVRHFGYGLGSLYGLINFLNYENKKTKRN